MCNAGELNVSGPIFISCSPGSEFYHESSFYFCNFMRGGDIWLDVIEHTNFTDLAGFSVLFRKYKRMNVTGDGFCYEATTHSAKSSKSVESIPVSFLVGPYDTRLFEGPLKISLYCFCFLERDF